MASMASSYCSSCGQRTSNSQDLYCGNCGKVGAILREKYGKGEVFTEKCPKCGHESLDLYTAGVHESSTGSLRVYCEDDQYECPHCPTEVPDVIIGDETDSDNEEFDEESLIRYYFNRGFNYEEIRLLLSKRHHHDISYSTLLRRLNAYGLKRRNFFKNATSNWTIEEAR